MTTPEKLYASTTELTRSGWCCTHSIDHAPPKQNQKKLRLKAHQTNPASSHYRCVLQARTGGEGGAGSQPHALGHVAVDVAAAMPLRWVSVFIIIEHEHGGRVQSTLEYPGPARRPEPSPSADRPSSWSARRLRSCPRPSSDGDGWGPVPPNSSTALTPAHNNEIVVWWGWKQVFLSFVLRNGAWLCHNPLLRGLTTCAVPQVRTGMFWCVLGWSTYFWDYLLLLLTSKHNHFELCTFSWPGYLFEHPKKWSDFLSFWSDFEAMGVHTLIMGIQRGFWRVLRIDEVSTLNK